MKLKLIITGIIIFIGTLGVIFTKHPFSKKLAGLEIETVPSAQVFLNDEYVGDTPYKNLEIKPGEYHLKLVPQSSDKQTLPVWETKLNLKSKTTTIANKIFAPTETDSSSYILKLIPESGNQAYLSVISDPDTINLQIDGKPNGYTPITKLEINPGSHQLVLSSPGYKTQTLAVDIAQSYNLIVNVQLASEELNFVDQTDQTKSSNKSTQPSPTPNQPHVIIQETGTGWLRVRQEPSSASEELGKVNVGETLPYLGETSDTGWHQVEFEGQKGWLSAKYVKLVK